eukprot:jgi/Undpi1/1457/HiC_scaffold_11.g04848.m1
MSARVSFDSSGGNGSQGPAWGLKEQLKHFDNDAGKDVTGSTDGKNRPATTKSKIRVSVTGPGLADKIRQHFGREKASHREVLGFCAQEVDKTVSVLVHRVKSQLLGAIEKMDDQLLSLEGNMRRLGAATEDKGLRMMREAKRTADSEREEKAILCQWLNGFLASASSEPQLTSMDFTFARFALNMAMASSRTKPEAMVNAGAPAFLVGMLNNPNELVIGPAVMGLSQMAQHEACQRALGLAGGIPPLVLLCFENQSPAVLTQVCVSLAQLSRYAPNRSIIASKGGIAGMARLLDGFRKEERVTVQVVEHALSMLVNVMFRSDANRGLAEECGVALPAIAVMDSVQEEGALVQACLALANMSFGNQFAALRLLEAGADKAACDLIRDSDKTRHSDVAEAAFICLANLANNDLNQAHVGAGSSVELAISVCKHCRSARVVRAAALTLCSLTVKNEANKTRCASFDAVPIMLELGAAWGMAGGGERHSDEGSRSTRYSDSSAAAAAAATVPSDNTVDEEGAAAAQAMSCVAILMQHATNALAMKRVGGLRQITELIHDSENNEVMTAAAKAVVILIPDPEALVRTARDGGVSQMEEVGAHEALVRAREWAFGRKLPPSWLLYGLDVLGCDADALHTRLQEEGPAAFRKPGEFFKRAEFFEERETIIPPDVTLSGDEDLGGMLFHVF